MVTTSGGTKFADEDFGYEIRLADSFEGVLDGSTDAPGMQAEEFAQTVLRGACTLLQGRGGSGKTRTAMRVAEALEAQGRPSVFVAASAVAQRSEFASLGAGSWSRVGSDERQGTPSAVPALIVIDGLNEVDRETGNRILDAVGPYTALHPQTSVLVTDRLARRDGASPFWRYATPLPVPAAVVEAIAGPDADEAYSIPFYLARHRDGVVASDLLYDSIRRYVTEEELPRLAEAAYRSYAAHKRRTIVADIAVPSVGAEKWQAMVDGRAIDELGAGHFTFEHHLLHDYLAGWHLAHHPDLWVPAGFDTVTFSASSFDSLALALTLVEAPAAVEGLVERVYNWNFYAAAYMLEEDRAGARMVSRAVAVALLGALAEKRFDPVQPTVTRVEDALRVQREPLSRALLAAGDREAAVECLESAAEVGETPDWFGTWWGQYSRPDGTDASPDDLATLAREAPIVGWGAANALRRFRLSEDQGRELRHVLRNNANPTVRWRAAHTLGAHVVPDNWIALRAAVRDDGDTWVKYGALRALLEHLRDAEPPRRPALVAELLTDVSFELGQPGPMRTEAIRCLDVYPLPDGNWHADIEPLLELLWETADARGAVELANLAERLRVRKDEAHVV